MREFLLNVLALLAALSIMAAVLYGVHVVSKPLSNFSIDVAHWSCSTTVDGRILSCTRHGSL